MKRVPVSIVGLLLTTLLVIVTVAISSVAPSHAQDAPVAMDQSVLGPGLYVFQTRTLAATCGDDERTGYVSSFAASIDGVPGSRSMHMHLLDARFWSSWTLTVNPAGMIHGESLMDGTTGANRPMNSFDVSRDATGRFTGHGARTYEGTVAGHAQHCQVTFDALLRRIDG